MYIGDVDDGSGLVHMALEVLEGAYDKYLAGRCTRVHLAIDTEGVITVEDDGRGYALDGADGFAALTELLTSWTADKASSTSPRMSAGLRSVGLYAVNALSERFELVSVRDGIEARATCAKGVMLGAIETTATSRSDGTRIRFLPDRSIFRHVHVPRAHLTQVLENFTFVAPGVALTWSMDGGEVPAHGLAACVALRAKREIGDVAAHSTPYAPGAIGIDVALVWRDGSDKAAIESFVNLRPTHGGTHVVGLVEGIRAFVGGGRREVNTVGLIAAVSVVMVDVSLGDSTRGRLDSEAARPAVAAATMRALEVWAQTHELAAAALRARLRGR
jgi:DNA gyrase subunit B